jgi:hypothetical protein
MSIDAIATERQFVDHLAPIWRALPDRGTFHVDETLADHADRRVTDFATFDAEAVRRSMREPGPQPGDGPRALVASYGDIKVARRMGYRRFAFLEHGAGQAYGRRRHGSYAGGQDREDCEMFLCPNHYSADLWRQAYPSARVEVVGSPRLADLPARVTDGGRTVAISFHWPAHVHPFAGNALGDFRHSLAALAERYNVIGHAHPKGDWPERMARIYAKAGIPFVRDFDYVCRQADLYIADNTSTLFEFAATGRPVVVLNARGWTRKLSVGLRFWDAAHVGVNVDPVMRRSVLDQAATTTALLGAVAEALEDDQHAQERREDALRIVYAARGHEATQRAVRAVLAWQDAEVPLAA